MQHFYSTSGCSILALLFASCGTPEGPPPDQFASDANRVLVGAGDIASCSSNGDEATAALLDDIEGTVFTTGDNAYSSGTSREFQDCYDPSWGRHRHRTRPSPGNHEYNTSGASGYFAYFGNAAGSPGKGYYSYDLAGWHIVVIDSERHTDEGDPAQVAWLRQDLASHRTPCTLAYWHHPRFSSGTEHGSESLMEDIWQILYDDGADVALAGHEHNYERFAPLTPQGKPDPDRGIRQFVVGTGGRSLYDFGQAITGSEFRYNDDFGVLKLVLLPSAYQWQFINTARVVIDQGSGSCH
jgi:acid phosphatase type 7